MRGFGPKGTHVPSTRLVGGRNSSAHFVLLKGGLEDLDRGRLHHHAVVVVANPGGKVSFDRERSEHNEAGLFFSPKQPISM